MFTLTYANVCSKMYLSYRRYENNFCEICVKRRGMFGYSFHETCGIMKKNVGMERSIYAEDNLCL